MKIGIAIVLVAIGWFMAMVSGFALAQNSKSKEAGGFLFSMLAIIVLFASISVAAQ